ncbi:TIGR02680 family protein [Streptomyces sp. 5.8]|uniref:TIGR02680 family protein n=1 Tax=Streptomyces sp. 5.8 TaxID=3406571 RepID=UPI003BB7DFE3
MTRFEPTRAGIVNLWDYRDEEFCFAGGWLVLRGPNGSGKTKALEVLFPYVLDGRIDPKRLNPFAAEDRTMKSNLLFRGQENAVGYVWLELTHRDTGEAVTIGVGLHAQRHRDAPVRWHFVIDGRVGQDFSLLTADDRPMTKKQLSAELGEGALLVSPTDYRAAIDRRLFGLGRERYEQLLTLILTLRRPQLAKNLDPVKLSGTLTEGLRPLDDDLIAEAARSFDDMESVARTLEGLTAADEATRSFLAGYTTYVRTHARWAADALTRRLHDTGARRQAVASSQTALVRAEEEQTAAEARCEAADSALTTARARVEQLRSSAAYQAVEQLADLERLVRTCEQADQAAETEAARRAEAAGRARRERERAHEVLTELQAQVSRTAARLAQDAAAAGIAWSPADAEAAGLAERVAARSAERHEAIRALRAALEAHRAAEQARDLARRALDAAQETTAAAEAAEAEAAEAVEQRRAEARAELTRWLDEHTLPLDTDAAARLDTALSAALEQAGEPDAPSLEAVFGEETAACVQQVRDERSALRTHRTGLERTRQEAVAERDAIAAERDDAPPPSAARRADRTDRAGAPLWQLVRFADDVDDATAAALEAALEASGMLDAWIHPADHTVAAGDSDGYLLPGAPVRGASLAGPLVPEGDAVVSAARISAVLASIALTGDVAPGPAQVTTDGRYAHGVTVGAHRKEHAEYVGATARGRRRAARIADCEQRIAALDAQITEAGRGLARLDSALDAFAAARAALPRTGPIAAALREEIRAAGRLRAARAAADAAQSAYDESVASCTVAERAVRRTAAEGGLDPSAVDHVQDAVRRFETGGGQLTAQRREQDRQHDSVTEATERLEAAAEDEQLAADAARAARRRHTEETAKLDALRGAVGAEAREVMDRIEHTEHEITAAEAEDAAARTAEREALTVQVAARERLAAARQATAVAAAEERETAHGLGPYAARELLDVLKCPPGLAWPAQQDDWADDHLPQVVTDIHAAILDATRELTPTETSLKQSATRLTKALDELQTQLGAAGQDYHPEWDSADGVIVVRIADEQGPLPVGAFAARIAAARRDQQLLLSESEQRILEDALLTRLAQQIHERTVDARDLIHRMNAEMRQRKMSSGTTVGVNWLLADDLDPEQRQVSSLLDADAARLGPDALTKMRGHFADRIKNARAVHRELPFRELLAQVLDYRRWRQFAFQLVRPDGSEQKLTRARHSRLSGGEQSVSLHLPLFAAAHATLNSAAPHAPRLLALDEAFAGVDDTGRGELMSLAAQFDLDLFMTGYDLWATHADVRAAAHYDLAHSPAEHTVSALLLVWDGTELLADDAGELAAALGSPGARRRTAEPEPAA